MGQVTPPHGSDNADSAMMPVLLTRPEAQSRAFANALRNRFGAALEIVESPLLEIRFLQPDVAFEAYDGVVFTSQNGVAAAKHLGLPKGIKAYCVGDRTAEAAAALGCDVTSASGDVDALGTLISDAPLDQRFLHLRGRHAAGTLPENVTPVVAYEQVALALNGEARRLLSDGKQVAVPLFSPRTAALFQAGLESGWGSSVYAFCISKNAAFPLDQGRLHAIQVCSQPTAEAMIVAIADVLTPPSA